MKRRSALQGLGSLAAMVGATGCSAALSDETDGSPDPAAAATPANTAGVAPTAAAPALLVAHPKSGNQPIISGTVRTRPPSAVASRAPGNDIRCARERHHAPLPCARPQAHWFNGRVVNSGAAGMEIEQPQAGPITLRAAWVTGRLQPGLDQSGARVTPMTFNTLRSNPEFLRAGGNVSADGTRCVMPPGFVVASDPVPDLTLHGDYFIQTEYSLAPDYPDSRFYTSAVIQDGRFGDARGPGPGFVHQAGWSEGSGAELAPVPGRWFGLGPLHVTGLGPTGTPVIAIDGDSIIAEVASGPDALSAPSDLDSGVDSKGALCFAKRALVAAGLPFFDISVSGTRIEDIKRGFQNFSVRGRVLSLCDVVITDMGHNDRRSGRGGDHPLGLEQLLSWHNRFLRQRMKAGGRIIRTTLVPGYASSDRWSTVAGQTPKNEDCAPGGAVDRFNDRVMRRGPYSRPATARDPGMADASFDLAAVCADPASGRWRVNGQPDWATRDGTHPSLAMHREAAVKLGQQLGKMLGT